MRSVPLRRREITPDASRVVISSRFCHAEVDVADKQMILLKLVFRIFDDRADPRGMKDLPDTQTQLSPDGNPRAVSVRLESRNMSKAKGTRRHDFRIGKLPNYVNKDRVDLNCTLMPMRPLPEIQKENAELRKKAGRQRAMKSNAAVITSGIITFGREAARMFETLPPDRQDDAFRNLAKAIAAQLDTSLESLVVHLDESTIHAHFTLRSYTTAGLALSEAAKRGTMARLQDLAAEIMQQYEPGIERGHRKWDRIEAGADYPDTLHRSVRELHQDLPAELEVLRRQRDEQQRALAEISSERKAERVALDALLADREDVETDLDLMREEQQTRIAELARMKADEKAQQAELDVLTASADKTRRHLAELDAKAVEEEKKDKRRKTYLVRLEKKETEIAAQQADLARRSADTAAAEAALTETARHIETREADLALREQRQTEAAETTRLKGVQLEAEAVDVSRREEEVAAARSNLETEAEEVRTQKWELDTSLAAIDHVLGAVETGAIRVNDNGKITLDDTAPVLAAPKFLRSRLLPSIIRLVRKIDETDKRASRVEEMMTRVRRLLCRPDVPKDVEKEANEITLDWDM
ncbi:plasmid recombination protein [Roseicyclus sp. F158]|uniref:Plasmid recombination protein n=1 Tax=Tropicimonas omnivorans TaxID=3075590 RepID=A0ABU3DLH9_9RHOB|nr:plasmid recombination protein [Roseicyclus sp. F158]MDT0684516.1 plasmid recombination protein [Roseicyclus sp. F158]